MKTLIKIIIPIAIIVAAIFGFQFLIKSKPKPKSKQASEITLITEVITAEPSTHSPPVITFGTVQSYFETNLTAQVPGRITFVSPNFRIGKTVQNGTILARIDDTDYQAALAQEQYNLSLAQRTLAEEEVLAKQAANDWIASGRNIKDASPFVLRTPQLEAARSNITSTNAAIAKANKDIERTEIKAPFEAIITSRTTSIGNYATIQSTLGSLIPNNKVEIRLSLNIDQASRIQRPNEENPPQFELSSPAAPGVTWNAKLVRTEPTIDPQNQITYVIAEVENPYSGDKPPLPIGTFVNASIPAKPLGQCYSIPETALVNDSFIWTTTTKTPEPNISTSDKKNKTSSSSIKEETVLKQTSVTRLYSQKGITYIQLTESSNDKPITLITRPLTSFKPGTKIQPKQKETSEKTPTEDIKVSLTTKN